LSAASTNRLLIGLEALAGLGVVAAIIGKTYGAAPTVFFMIAATATAFAAWMLVRAADAWRDAALDVEGKTRDTGRERLEQEKRLLLQGIKELETDVAAGKVDARDYEHLRRTAEERAMDIIEAISTDDRKWLEQAARYFEKKVGHPPLGGLPSAEAPLGAAAPGTEPADPKCFDDRSTRFEVVDGKLGCAACRSANDEDARYCVGCGRPRAPDAREVAIVGGAP
jgi:hypothetical protein